MIVKKSWRGKWALPTLILGLCLVLMPITVQAHGENFETVLIKVKSDVDLQVQFPGADPIKGFDSDEVVNLSTQFAAFARATTLASSDFFGRGAAYQDQFGINAVFVDSMNGTADGSTFIGSANTTYISDVFENSGHVSSDDTVPFTFVINGGEVRIRNFSQFNPPPMEMNTDVGGVTVTADIRIDLDKVWRFTTGISKDPVTQQPIIVGDALGNVDTTALNGSIHPTLTPTVDGDDVYVTIPRIEGTLDIPIDDFGGILGTNGVRFQYFMSANINLIDSFGASGLAGITDPFALGTPSDMSDDLGGPFDPLGIQFFLDGVPFSDFPVMIPEPRSAAILGLVVMGWLVWGRMGSTLDRTSRIKS